MRAEEALRESEQQLRLVTEALPVLIAYVGADERYRFVNGVAAEWFGRPVSEIIGVSMEENLGRETYAQLHPYLAAALSGTAQNFDATVTYPDGGKREMELIYVPHFGLSDEVLGFFSLGIDVTERRALHAQLRQTQKMQAIGQLTGGVAHDFNNILAAIIGNLDLIRDDAVTDEFDRRSIATALRAAFRGAELTHHLLAFSRQQELNAQVTEINEMLPEFRELARRTIDEDITIEIRPAADLWPTVVDAGQLESALLNLAINARDAMPNGGQLTIETANRVLGETDTATDDDLEPGPYVVIAVSDSGTGMPAETRQRAFEPFFTTKEVGEGSGLGLSMVFGFAKQSGGHVSIDSVEGKGTTVSIYLPRADGTVAAEDATEESTPGGPRGNERILVVEDDRDVRNYLVTALGRLGYDVLAAADGPRALEIMAAADTIDLLLTDVILPRGMSGHDVAQAFRERYPAAGVLFSSGYTRDVLDSRGHLEEGEALIHKPFGTRMLAERLREVIGD